MAVAQLHAGPDATPGVPDALKACLAGRTSAGKRVTMAFLASYMN